MFEEHQALKRMRVVKMLRRFGAFSATRKMFPGAKRALGDG